MLVYIQKGFYMQKAVWMWKYMLSKISKYSEAIVPMYAWYIDIYVKGVVGWFSILVLWVHMT